MSITRRLHALLRKILFSWIRVDVLPQNPLQEIDPDKPVLYVLAARGLSELLVLERMCKLHGLHDPLATIAIHGFRHHSVYSVASRNPVSDWLLQQKKHSLMLQELVAALQADNDIDITVVPVSVFWGRPIAKQRHWLMVLFSDTWELAGWIRKFFTILVNGRQTTLIFSPPGSFRELCTEADNSVEVLNDALALILRQQREATFGPEVVPRTRMISNIINAPKIKQQYDRLAEEKRQSLEKSRKQAIKYCNEIMANCTQISQELMKRLLSSFWQRFYSGIEVFDIEQVKNLALTHQLIYLPNHRSHIDYLLLSYVIFKEGLALPYIAAGDNLNMPIIGHILKGGGAFFIRRSFRDNPLYSAILSEYVRELVQMGVPIEYFIEGGRSRTGRLLKPKLGMLSMTVDGWIQTRNRPLAFIPVYIGYEKLVEGRAHLGELYGQKKKKESLLSSIRSIFKLRGQFGKVTTRFGQPITLDQWLDSQAPDWSEASMDNLKQEDWFRLTVKDLASRIMMEINRAAVVNPVNLIATTLLATPRQSIDEYDLLQLCEFYQRLIKSQPQLDSIRIQDRVNEKSLQRIMQQGLIRIREHQLGNIVYLKPEHAVLMSYYRNNTLHALIIPSLTVCSFLNIRHISQQKLIEIISYVYPFLASELHLPWNEQQLQSFIPQVIDFLIKEKLLIRKNDKLLRPDRSDVHYLMLSRLAHIALPVLERYYMTFMILWQSGDKPLTEAQIEQRCHLVAQKVSMIYGINSPDFFDRELFGHFIDTLFKLDFIERDADGRILFQESFNQINIDIRVLLSVEVRSTILQLLNSSHHHDLPDNRY